MQKYFFNIQHTVHYHIKIESAATVKFKDKLQLQVSYTGMVTPQDFANKRSLQGFCREKYLYLILFTAYSAFFHS